MELSQSEGDSVRSFDPEEERDRPEPLQSQLQVGASSVRYVGSLLDDISTLASFNDTESYGWMPMDTVYEHEVLTPSDQAVDVHHVQPVRRVAPPSVESLVSVTSSNPSDRLPAERPYMQQGLTSSEEFAYLPPLRPAALSSAESLWTSTDASVVEMIPADRPYGQEVLGPSDVSGMKLIETMRRDRSYEQQVLNLPDNVTEYDYYSQSMDTAIRAGLLMSKSDLVTLFGFASATDHSESTDAEARQEKLYARLQSLITAPPILDSVATPQRQKQLSQYPLPSIKIQTTPTYTESIDGDTSSGPPPLTPDTGSMTDEAPPPYQRSQDTPTPQESKPQRAQVCTARRPSDIPTFRGMRAAQHSMRERFLQYEQRQVLRLGLDQARRKDKLLEAHDGKTEYLEESHSKILAETEDRHLEEELEIEERQLLDTKASAGRLKHIEAACAASPSCNRASRIITEDDRLHLARNRLAHVALTRRHADEIRILRTRQALKLAALEAAQAAEVSALEGRHVAALDGLNKAFDTEMAAFDELFDARMKRLVLGWFLDMQCWREGDDAGEKSEKEVDEKVSPVEWLTRAVWETG